MAAYRRVYDSRHLQADCKNRDQLRNPTLGNRVWATFTFLPTDFGLCMATRLLSTFGSCIDNWSTGLQSLGYTLKRKVDPLTLALRK